MNITLGRLALISYSPLSAQFLSFSWQQLKLSYAGQRQLPLILSQRTEEKKLQEVMVLYCVKHKGGKTGSGKCLKAFAGHSVQM